MIPDFQAYTNALAGGQIDIGSFQPGNVAALEGRDGLTTVPVLQGTGVELYFNTGKEPLDDIRVRRAINHAYDREAIVEALYPAPKPVTNTHPRDWPATTNRSTGSTTTTPRQRGHYWQKRATPTVSIWHRPDFERDHTRSRGCSRRATQRGRHHVRTTNRRRIRRHVGVRCRRSVGVPALLLRRDQPCRRRTVPLGSRTEPGRRDTRVHRTARYGSGLTTIARGA